jgi:hypothetical protein
LIVRSFVPSLLVSFFLYFHPGELPAFSSFPVCQTNLLPGPSILISRWEAHSITTPRKPRWGPSIRQTRFRSRGGLFLYAVQRTHWLAANSHHHGSTARNAEKGSKTFDQSPMLPCNECCTLKLQAAMTRAVLPLLEGRQLRPRLLSDLLVLSQPPCAWTGPAEAARSPFLRPIAWLQIAN